MEAGNEGDEEETNYCGNTKRAGKKPRKRK